MSYILTAAFELALKLPDHRVAMLRIHLIEHTARDYGNACSDQANGQQQRNHEIQEQLGAKRHYQSFRSLPFSFVSSQTSASGQVCPGAGAVQFRTRVLRP